MLTSLLTSLHTHLQTQTQLLPTLYAQLGLPTTALEDELKALQQQLVEKIEVQIDKRRKEVDEWMEKCEALENQCTRYTKALGANIKATGTSLGELRKEQALPHRYDMISEYQEKLRQVRATPPFCLDHIMTVAGISHQARAAHGHNKPTARPDSNSRFRLLLYGCNGACSAHRRRSAGPQRHEGRHPRTFLTHGKGVGAGESRHRKFSKDPCLEI